MEYKEKFSDFSHVEVEKSTNMSLFDLFYEVDTVITQWSSVVSEGTYFGLKGIVIGEYGKELMKSEIEEKTLLHASNSSELNNCLQNTFIRSSNKTICIDKKKNTENLKFCMGNFSKYSVIIILPVFNRKRITLQFVEYLKSQTTQDYLLLLVDNGSDGTYLEVEKKIPNNVKTLKGYADLWWGDSLEYAYQYLLNCKLKENVIIHINNDDTHIDEGFLMKGQELISEYGGLICAQAVSDKTNEVFDKGICIDWMKLKFNSCEKNIEPNCLSTRGLFLSFSDMKKLGGFRPKWLHHYLSDYEFTVRASQKGYRLRTFEELKIICRTEETGIHIHREMGLSELFSQLFSLKNALNPWEMTKFLLLRCPKKYLLLNLSKQSVKIFKYFVKSTYISIKRLTKNV